MTLFVFLLTKERQQPNKTPQRKCASFYEATDVHNVLQLSTRPPQCGEASADDPSNQLEVWPRGQH